MAPLRFLYATDLHGDESKFLTLQHYATKLGINLIHLGADLLPGGSEALKEQKKFVDGFLRRFYRQCKKQRITLLAFFGNDDFYTRKKYFTQYADLLDEKPYVLDGYTFTAYGYVPDYRFRLKMGCKLDYKGWSCPEPYDHGNLIDIGPRGKKVISNIKEYFLNKGTIEDDLSKMKGGDRAIVAIHAPPSGLGLDIVLRNQDLLTLITGTAQPPLRLNVGSKAVRDWILREQPRLVLSGHIHYGPKVSGKWKARLGKTLVIQPGQEERKTVFVAIEVSDNNIHCERFTPDK